MEKKIPRRHRIQTLFHRIEDSTTNLVSLRTPEPKPEPTLCESCQLLRFQPLRKGELHSHSNSTWITSSAKAGCRLCGLLLEYFDLGPPNQPIRFSGIRKRLSVQEKACLVEEGDIEALGVFNGYDRDFENPFAHKLALYTTYG